MAVDCTNVIEVRQTVCNNATDIQEMITLPDTGERTTNYNAKPISLIVKEKLINDLQALGIDYVWSYVWANEAERNAQTGMSIDDYGYQSDTGLVYQYDGSLWQVQTVSTGEYAYRIIDSQVWKYNTSWNFYYAIGGSEFSDNEFLIKNESDNTKTFSFDASLIPTNTKNIYKVPNTSGTFLISSDLTGIVIAYASSTVPDGFLECDGSAISRTTYSELFAIIGTTYGIGDGSTTFNIPDLRGEFIRGWDNGRGIDSNRNIGTSQNDELKSHTHTESVGRSGQGGSEFSINNDGNTGFNITGATGGSETRPRNIAMMYCIKY